MSINNWINNRIFDESSDISSFLSELCSKLYQDKCCDAVSLFGLRNGSVIKLHSTGEGSAKAKQVSGGSVKLPRFEGVGPNIVEEGNNHISIYCQIIYNQKPIFVLKTRHHDCDKKNLRLAYISIADSLNLAFIYKEERRLDGVREALLEEFFKRRLSPSEAWKIIAEYATQFLPDFPPFNIAPKPLSQILTYKSGEKHIILRASQSGVLAVSSLNERIAIPLKVDETVSGIPIQRNLEFLLTNPTKEYPDRYQAYLYSGRRANSELVFSIRHDTKNSDNEIIALLNIEHPDEGVFNEYSVEAIRRAGKFLSPFVWAIMETEEAQRDKEISLLYVMTGILGRMASMYRHKIDNLLFKSRFLIHDISKRHANDKDTQRDINDLELFINDFDEKSRAFLTDLPNYIEYQNIGVNYSIREAIKDIDAEKLEKDKSVKFKVKLPEKEIFVYASQMLKEHIYNLINNSVLAIKQRISDKMQQSGVIEVLVTYKKVTDTLRKDSRASPSRVYIKIVDNGGGVPEEHYPEIEEFGKTTRREKGGTGYGLPAAKEYVQSINGGAFKTSNEPNKGFTVSFFIQEFDPSFHKTEGML